MIKKPRGTRDYFGEDIKYFNYIKDTITKIVKTYDIEEIRLPMFEDVELYKRGTGETTDIVTKEIYQFNDKGNRNLALRPEGTAGVMRSYIENKLYGDFSQTTKQYYISEFFRYERPQNGRQRQFHQFGVEYLNISSPLAIVEIFSQITQILKALNINDVNFTINNLGTPKQRELYKTNLIKYLLNYEDLMCEDCKKRLKSNPLRTLDCKIDGQKDFLLNAPKINDYYDEKTRSEFIEFLNYLDELNIAYKVEPTMVRGLDYYSNIIFEVDSKDNTLLGGGCYNSLFNQLGGNGEVNAIGYGIGIERLMNYLQSKNIKLPKEEAKVYIIDKVNSPSSKINLIKLVKYLRENNVNVSFDLLNKSQKSLFKYSNNFEGYVVTLDHDDILNNEITVFENKIKTKLSWQNLLERIKNV